MKTFIKTAGSLPFAVFLIGSLLILLVVSTFTESYFGTPFVQKTFYQAGWFDVFLALFAVCIVCSTLTRFPFKRKHTGFVLTHIGILFLLTGSLLSRLMGVDGQMLLYENDKRSEILQTGYEIVAHRHGGQTAQADLREKAGSAKLNLKTIEKGLSLSVSDITENGHRTWDVRDGGTEPNAAVQLTLESDLAGLHETFWLVEKHPADPDSADRAMGPAHILLQRKSARPQTSAKTLIVSTSAGETAIDLDHLPGKDIEAGGYRVRNIRFYPDARVSEENKLISVSEEPHNPAVEYEAVDAEGKTHRIVYFSLFPDFQSMHEKEGTTEGLETRLEVAGAEREISGPSLKLVNEAGHWRYVSRSSKQTLEGDLKEGEFQKTGWMDFRFKAEKIVERAELSEKVEKLEKGKGELAARATLKKNGSVVWEDWLMEEQPREAGGKDLEGLVLMIRRKSTPVPFSLQLKDFRKVDYPGTASAMSYESDVSLEDEKEKIVIQKTISMNKPLDYKGFRIFQSSFIQTPDSPEEASVFTVAKNPGVPFIYAGAIILFSGVFILFFVKPLSSFNM